ncbi:uncharacterized protein PHACADRAFT_210445 [Phanerochaete carnosa HHB-10118-sp]|uniref:Uncharacterized protein n=1 Tax=Phanerochaete carnosa (strain HHB-10118-sp) TaxID=650164 RepID=K5WW12_PHACS|nr:uncharacterized protein PHACADRAFT_210445 [Phanerochaete carnosa HHB-10118-sp]EKM54652.1 hypothetical protein PHACADRAFT_210445 [Phanerochaete carnosa HHB-10118-sp]
MSRSTDIYLTMESGELVVRQGLHSSRGVHMTRGQHIIVAGGGVTRLTWAFLDAGYSVTIVYDRWASLDRITAQIAGALIREDSLLPRKLAVCEEVDTVDAYKHASPVVDTDVYMARSRLPVENKAKQFITHRVSGNIFEQEDTLESRNVRRTVHNQSHRLGTKLAKLEEVQVYVVAYDENKRDEDGGVVFIVPQNNNAHPRWFVPSCLAQLNEGKIDLTIDSPEIRRTRERCNRFLLECAEIDPHSPCPGDYSLLAQRT